MRPETRPVLQGRQLRLVMFLVTGALFMEVLDGNIIATALPSMAHSFGVQPVELNVAMSAYMLALAVFIPVSGWIADRLGGRQVFALAIAGFTLSSMACGLAPDLHTFVGLRVVQGACGALMVPVGRLLILRHTPLSGRMAAMSSLIWPALIAPVIAPPLGGFITSHASWHWIFYLNVPLGIVGLILALYLIPKMDPEPRKPFDWPGFFLSGLGIFAFAGALEQLTTTVDAMRFGVMAAGVILLIAAARHFRRVPHPMLDLASMRIQTFRAAILGGSISRMGISTLPFLLPLLFQVGFGLDAFHSGLWLLVMFAGNFAMKAVTTPTLRRYGYRMVMLWNGVIAAFCIAAWALVSASTSAFILVPLLFLSGLARSLQFTSISTLAMSDIPEKEIRDANGLMNVISQLGMAAGITLGALALRVGETVPERARFALPVFEYKVAFVIAAIVCLIGLWQIYKLPANAADHFVGRE